MPIDFNNLPDPYETKSPVVDPNAPPPPRITEGESPSGFSDRLSYYGQRVGRALTEEAQQAAQPRAQWPGLIPYLTGTPVTTHRSEFGEGVVGAPIPAQPAAPDRFSEIIGSGFENLARHPVLSYITPGVTATTGATNELLKDFPAPVREGVGAAMGLIGPAGVAHLMQNVGHLITGHFGGIGTMLHALVKAPASNTSFNAANALSRIAKSVIGEGLGSETPLSRGKDKPQPTPSTKTEAAPPTDNAASIGGEIANRLYHWGGVLGWPSTSDIVNQLTPGQ